MAVTDGQGNSNQPISTAYRLKVPGVLEQIIGNNSMRIITPVNNTYTVRFTGSGEPIAIENIRGTTNQLPDATYIVYYDDVVIPAGAVSDFKIVNDQVDSLRYDSNGDGKPDTVIPPSRVVTSPQSADLQAPDISVDWFRPFNAYEVLVSLIDNNSGVRRLFYRYGSGAGPWVVLNQSSYYNPQLAIAITGIEVVSEDNAGNRSGVRYYQRP